MIKTVLMQAICTAIGYLPALLIQFSIPEDEGVAIGAGPIALLGILAATGVGGFLASTWVRADGPFPIGWASGLGALLAVVMPVVVMVGLDNDRAWVLVAAVPSMLLAGVVGWGGGSLGALFAQRRAGH